MTADRLTRILDTMDRVLETESTIIALVYLRRANVTDPGEQATIVDRIMALKAQMQTLRAEWPPLRREIARNE